MRYKNDTHALDALKNTTNVPESMQQASVTDSSISQTSLARGHVIVVGNEKGGSGKTTTCMHLIVGLLRLGFRVGSIDIDARQRSLTRYIDNRKTTIAKEAAELPMPVHVVINKSPLNIREEIEEDERERFTRVLAKMMVSCDFIVIDAPGNDTYLSRLAHSCADTAITPINDSFVDLDVLASVDGMTLQIQKPSIYSEMLWEQKIQRAKRDGGSIDWIVMRNRLSNLDARNKRQITKVLEKLSQRLGCRIAPGFSERVIFRELFLLGLTVLDVVETSKAGSLSMSHLAARQEVRDLLRSLQIPVVEQRIARSRAGHSGDALTDPKIAPPEPRQPKEQVSTESASANEVGEPQAAMSSSAA